MQTAIASIAPETLSPAMVMMVDKLYHAAQQSQKALEYLAEHGFVAESFIAGRAKKPVIEIRFDHRALPFFSRQKGFKTYAYITRHGVHGREYVMRATVFDCFIQWVESAGAA